MRAGAAAAALAVAAASVGLIVSDPPSPTPSLLGVVALTLLSGALYASSTRSGSPTPLPFRQETDPVRRKSSQYKYEAKREPFELELDAADDDGQPFVIVFTDPNALETDGAFDLAVQDDPKRSLQTMLDNVDGSDSGQWEKFWPEWRSKPVGALNDLLSDVMNHYGADQGKVRRSSR